MKKIRSLLALLLCLGLLSGCGGTKESAAPDASAAPVEEATSAPETEETDWAALYSLAGEEIAGAEDLTVTGTVREERTIRRDTVRERSSFTARFQGRGTDGFTADVDQTVQVGNVRGTFRQLYAEGTVYTEIKSRLYRAETSPEEFMAAQLPDVMLDPTLYGSVAAKKTERGTLLTFSDPVKAEAWAAPDTARLLRATGTALLSEEGALLSQSYELSVVFAGVTVSTEYTAELDTSSELDLSGALPSDAEAYTRLDTSLAPLVLLRARAALENVSMAGTETSETIVSHAAGFAEMDSINRYYYFDEEGLLCKETQQTSTYNGNTGEETNSRDETRYADGILTFIRDDAEEEQMEADDETVLEYLQSGLTDYLPGFDDLAGAEISWEGDYLLLSFTGDEDYGAWLEDCLCEGLFKDPDLLDRNSSRYETVKAEGYLGIDTFTWLPSSLNVDYTGVHTIDGDDYELTLQFNRAFALFEPDVYERITGEPIPDGESTETPTPVFYEVTGEDGGKMYLFGTIHVGDDRTGHLPRVILDAFDSADALAVEFDTDSFSEAVEDDEELQRKLAEAYYYLDGSDIRDHLEADVFDGAASLMKVTGDYTSMAENMKPFVWSFSIDNFYLAQGRELMSSKGVDSRLLRRARDTDKTILDVESGEFQMNMLSGYSDAVQEMMLAGSASQTRSKYLLDLEELYEHWCTGDEATLIELLSAMDEEEREEVEAEELALYDEFHQKMELERNAHMLQVAKEYLSGGETVFYAVGLAHLLGEGGLVEALRDAGFTVTLVDTH